MVVGPAAFIWTGFHLDQVRCVSLASFSLTPTLTEVTVCSDALIWIQNGHFMISLFDFPSDNGMLAPGVCYHHTHTVGNPNSFSCYLFCSGGERASVCRLTLNVSVSSRQSCASSHSACLRLFVSDPHTHTHARTLAHAHNHSLSNRSSRLQALFHLKGTILPMWCCSLCVV